MSDRAPPSPARGPSRSASRGSSRHGDLPKGVLIIYEDAGVLVVDKPPGLVSADPGRTITQTLFSILKDYAKRSGPKRPKRGSKSGRIWVIHRLDKEASGLLVFAKSQAAYDSLKEDFRTKRAHRLYLALVEGVVGPPGHTGTHQSFLKEDTRGHITSIAADQFRGRPGEEGRLAITHYRVLASDTVAAGGAGLSLVQVRLETGRKNQIRAHFAEMCHPLAGDSRHGAKTDPIGRLGLHAAELSFTQVGTGRTLKFTSPAPTSFYKAVGTAPPAGGASAPETTAPARPDRSKTPGPGAEPPLLDTTWDRVAGWYDQLLDEKGSDTYENVILPGALRLLRPVPGMRLLDAACGQGILCRRAASLGASVTGVDASAQLITAARRRSEHTPPPAPIAYQVGDARRLDELKLSDFDGAACIMALSNIDPLEPVIRGIAGALRPGGSFVAVISHPAFRAPGQTSWGWDAKQGRQFRRVDGYLSPGQHRIAMHPGKAPDVVTWTFHRPLQTYVKTLAEAGLLIDTIEEWPGQRTSTSGPRAKEENRARREIPLFLALRAVKAR